jgi:LEA14-like dessication related protein
VTAAVQLPVRRCLSFVPRFVAVLTLAAALLMPQGCALFKGRDPLHVTVIGVEPLDSQGLELRMLVKLRVQNPNDAPIDYNGVALEMSVRGKSFASGVSDVGGTVPRFGESVISVPVTASALSMLGQAYDLFRGGGSGPITYEMKGKLNGSGFNSTSFRSQGQLDLPASGAADQSD